MDVLSEGGAPVWGLVLCALVSHPIALAALGLALAKRSRGLALGMGAATVGLGMMALLLGVGGYLYGMHQVDAAVAYADPDSRELLRAVGQREAMISVWCGLGATALPLFLGLAAVARGLTIRADREASNR